MSDSVSSKEPSKEPSKEELIIPLIGNKEEDLLSPKTPPLAKKEKTLTGGNSSPKGRKSPKRLKSPIDPTPIFVNNKEVKRGDIPPILSPVNRRRGDKTAVKTSDKTEVKSSDKTSDNHFPDIADAKPDSFSPIPYIKNKEKDNETPFPNIPDNESNKKDFTDPHFYKVKYNSPGKHKKSGKSKTVKPEDNKADKLEDNKADKEKENIYKGSIHDLNPVPKSSFQQSVSITPIISPEVEKRKESPKKVENISPPKRPVSSVSRISKLPKPQTKVSSEHIGSRSSWKERI